MRGLAPFWIDPNDDSSVFPEVSLALCEPDGLLAIGGDLSPKRLAAAYQAGIFPWYNQDQPILWWSPNPRAVLFPTHLKVSRSLRKTLKRKPFELSFDRAFAEVVEACSQPRQHESGTWITEEMKRAYNRMHELGHAHSIECWQEGKLVGGLYGLAFGQVFFGESMFSRVRDASKVALVHLVRHLQTWGYQLIDCQVHSDHLTSLGAETIAREQFVALLSQYCPQTARHAQWRVDPDLAISPTPRVT